MLEARAGGLRTLQGVRDPFELTIFLDGKETDAATPPTVTVTRADGTAVATGAASTKPPDTVGLYRWTPAALDVADLESYTATWTATISAVVHTFRTRHEVVGGFYCDLAELREQDGIGNAAKFTDRRLLAARSWFEALVEEYCRHAFVPRYRREVRSGEGSTLLLLERWPAREVLALTVGTEVVTLDDDVVLERSGKLNYEGGFALGHGNVVVGYTHGEDAPDGELREATIFAVADRLRRQISGVADTALSMTTAEGTFNLSIAGTDRPTGIPWVDAVLRTRRGSAVSAR